MSRWVVQAWRRGDVADGGDGRQGRRQQAAIEAAERKDTRGAATGGIVLQG